MSATGILAEVLNERFRQDSKWGLQDHPNGTGPDLILFPHGVGTFQQIRDDAKQFTDQSTLDGSLTYADVLVEEVFEALAESDPATLRVELVQIAAVCVQWIQALDRRTAPAVRQQWPCE